MVEFFWCHHFFILKCLFVQHIFTCEDLNWEFLVYWIWKRFNSLWCLGLLNWLMFCHFIFLSCFHFVYICAWWNFEAVAFNLRISNDVNGMFCVGSEKRSIYYHGESVQHVTKTREFDCRLELQNNQCMGLLCTIKTLLLFVVFLKCTILTCRWSLHFFGFWAVFSLFDAVCI